MFLLIFVDVSVILLLIFVWFNITQVYQCVGVHIDRYRGAVILIFVTERRSPGVGTGLLGLLCAEAGRHAASVHHLHDGAGAANQSRSLPNRHNVMMGEFGRRGDALESGQRQMWLDAVRRITGVDPRVLSPPGGDRQRRGSRYVAPLASGAMAWMMAWAARGFTAPAGRGSITRGGFATPTRASGSEAVPAWMRQT